MNALPLTQRLEQIVKTRFIHLSQRLIRYLCVAMPPLNLTIRPTTIADVDQILSFIHQKAAFDGFTGTIAATVTTLKQTLFGDRPCAEVVFAEVDRQVVGFILFSQGYSSFLAQPTLWIDDLFVQSHWRRQGIGAALIKHVVHIAHQRQCGRIEWTVATQNPDGIAFYKQQGAQIQEAVRLCRMSAPTIAQLASCAINHSNGHAD